MYKKNILIIIFVSFVIPIIVNFISSFSTSITVGDETVWIPFFGSYLGSVIAVLGIYFNMIKQIEADNLRLEKQIMADNRRLREQLEYDENKISKEKINNQIFLLSQIRVELAYVEEAINKFLLIITVCRDMMEEGQTFDEVIEIYINEQGIKRDYSYFPILSTKIWWDNLVSIENEYLRDEIMRFYDWYQSSTKNLLVKYSSDLADEFLDRRRSILSSLLLIIHPDVKCSVLKIMINHEIANLKYPVLRP